MNAKYQMEINNFIQRFGSYQNARIILYGIGRYTITLLDGLEGFNIVGLMDKDAINVGKIIQNVPVVDKKTAEEIADMVIINTAETYWDIIYNRIKDIEIPIYYLNGEKAGYKENRKKDNSFKNLSYSELMTKLEKAEVISFDFFDTLFMRSVCSPQDIVRLMETEMGIPLLQIRDRAKNNNRENYSLNELYLQIELLDKLPHEQIEQIKNYEIALETELLVPRRQMILLIKELLEKNKEVYVVSDMYLPKKFYLDILLKYGISISDKVILLSNELDANKTDGTLWQYYAETIVKGRTALHIGDNIEADIKEPSKYGIHTYLTPSVWEMLLNSSLANIASQICGIFESTIMGCILARLFENPFVLEDAKGMLHIKSNYDMGYFVFGPVIMTFVLWLLNKIKEDRITKLVFMSRDGYFLKEDFEYICELLGEGPDCCYLEISRQLAMMASIENKQDLIEYIKMPYTGTIAELFEDRFGLTCLDLSEKERLEQYIDVYLPEIVSIVSKTKDHYLNYLQGFGFDDHCAVIDIGYYGNNQKYLNKLLEVQMPGYYFNANLAVENINVKKQRMVACFQEENDVTGESSQILKKQIYLESFLTAPYGMVKGIDEEGKLIYAPDGKNQKYFNDKKVINEGVKKFINDYLGRFGKFRLKPDTAFIDQYYGSCLGEGMEFTDEIKRSFYNDNVMMNRIESSLFY